MRRTELKKLITECYKEVLSEDNNTDQTTAWQRLADSIDEMGLAEATFEGRDDQITDPKYLKLETQFQKAYTTLETYVHRKLEELDIESEY